MLPHSAITRIWSDDDVAQLSFEVCDRVSTFTSEAHVTLEWGATAASALRILVGQIHGGLFTLEAGDGGPEYASGAFRARFHYYKPTHLLISARPGHPGPSASSRASWPRPARVECRLTNVDAAGRFKDCECSAFALI